MDEISRLRWQCRRGMLELDVALMRFLDEDYGQLTATQKAAFVRLLEMQDQVLHGWLMGRAIPEDPVFRELMDQLRGTGSRAAKAD